MNRAIQPSVASQDLAFTAGRPRIQAVDVFKSPAPPVEPVGGLVRASSLRVLLVDDCPFQQLLACALLSRWMIVPQIACDGLEAVLLAGEQDFDIVLMDVEMPVMDGLLATARIRKTERRDHRTHAVPVVAYTAVDLASHERSWQRCGMNAVLHKPAEAPEMSACLERWCGSKFSSSGHQGSARPPQPLEESVHAR
jgi:CheY-like chemotaxis protein